MDYTGQKVAVVGLGRSNIALIRWLLRHGAQVAAFDQAADIGERYPELKAMGVTEFSLGPGYLAPLPSYRTIFLTPGMRKDLPEIAAARAAGATLTGEIPLVLELCRARTVGITGSAGKTTTTSLLGRVLQAAGLEVHVGGNIGQPLIEQVEQIPPEAAVVLELSSFQLQLARHSPQVAVVTNVSPNHLDVHASMAEYVDAKRQIYLHQSPAGRAVFNADNEITARMADEVGERAVRFSLRGDPGGRAAAFLEADRIWWRIGADRTPILLRSEIRLLGDHNVENVLAVTAAAFLAGAGLHALRSAVPGFTGVEHRLEPVGSVDGVRYINDSKATAPVETLAALRAVPGPLVLIAGGYDKKIPFDELAAAVVRAPVHTLMVLGATAEAIAAAVGQAAAAAGMAGPRIERAADMAGAVRLARAAAQPGDTVLLSPACASYDMYRNFEERGRHFKALVQALAPSAP